MEFLIHVVEQVWVTFTHNWPFLLVSVIIATALKLYLDPAKVSAFLERYRAAGVLGATAAAVGTPLCSCGTTAVILGMMAGSMPWAPIVAFMVASPLTSPEELIYSAGLFGWRFAWMFFASSIVLGLLGGLVAGWVENRGWLKGQSRMNLATGVRRGSEGIPVTSSIAAARPAITLRAFAEEALRAARTLLLMFFGFAFIGYFLNGLIPSAWMAAVFGQGQTYGVPLAATLGLPLYINTEASLPLVRAMIDAGMSEGAALAFLITGAGTSVGAIAGALSIARWRVIALVIGVLWAGSIVLGLVYNVMI